MLEAIFNPASIAVIGASRDPQKVGYAVLDNLKKYNFLGKLYPVNPSDDEILGLKAYAKLADIGMKVDLAVIAIPARFVPQALR